MLNADVGEGIDTDADIMPYLTYANIACGGHFGDLESIAKTIALALKFQVLVGAHPSYLDKDNFGRESIKITNQALEVVLKNQIDVFEKQCAIFNIKMHHIKLHGALYNDVFNSKEKTLWFLEWVNVKYTDILIFIPLSAVSFIPKNFSNYLVEAFADRSYNNDLTLVSRNNPKAVLDSISKVEKQVSNLLNGEVYTLEGINKKIITDTICIHGDHPLVLPIAKQLKGLL